MGKVILLLIVCFFVSCRSSSNSNDSNQDKPVPNNSPEVDEAGGGESSGSTEIMYYGIITKCLKSVERRFDNNEQAIIWNPVCSPVLQNTDREALKKDLEAWHKDNCSENVTYPMPSGDTRNCWIVPGIFTKVASPRTKVDEELNTTGSCKSLRDTKNLTLGFTTDYGLAQCGL